MPIRLTSAPAPLLHPRPFASAHLCRFYDGSVAHLMLFNEALAAEQVAGLFSQYRQQNGSGAALALPAPCFALQCCCRCLAVRCFCCTQILSPPVRSSAHLLSINLTHDLPLPVRRCAGTPLVVSAEGRPDLTTTYGAYPGGSSSSASGLNGAEIAGIVIASIGGAIALITMLSMAALHVRRKSQG